VVRKIVAATAVDDMVEPPGQMKMKSAAEKREHAKNATYDETNQVKIRKSHNDSACQTRKLTLQYPIIAGNAA
jgi:hypothetical protein